MIRGVQLRRRAIIVALLCLLAVPAPVFGAGRNPADQKVAERLTLRFSDFASGWRIKTKISTRFRLSTCPNAPKVQRQASGFVDSAEFVRAGSRVGYAASTTRVFPTLERWFAFAGGGEQALCLQSLEKAHYINRGIPSSRLKHARQSFRPACTCSYPVRSWQAGYTLSPRGSRPIDVFFDVVAVRVERAVILFTFYEENRSLPAAEKLAGQVLARA
jgi:hypothetical protein